MSPSHTNNEKSLGRLISELIAAEARLSNNGDGPDDRERHSSEVDQIIKRIDDLVDARIEAKTLR